MPSESADLQGLRTAVLSVGGLGLLPRGGATAATLTGAGVLAALRPGLRTRLVLALGALCLGQALSRHAVTPGAADPQFIVIDELAGVWVALIAVPSGWLNCMLGALLFRLLDKYKPGAIGAVERRGGSWSVMGDDLAAGVAAGSLLAAGGTTRGRVG